jgi:secreted trypsin-like serine protease
MTSVRFLSFHRYPRVAILLLSAVLGLWPSGRAQAICNGHAVTTGFDFVVALFINGTFECGGTMLPGGWILTAAHCGNIETVIARSKVLTTSSGDKLPVDRCLRRADFKRATGENDLALIKVNSPLPVPAVSLVNPGWHEGADPLTILGYVCNPLFQLGQASVMPLAAATCAGSVASSKVLCTSIANDVGVGLGDSGGPVLAGSQLAGVISHGFGTNPDRHMRVTEYLDWIARVQAGDIRPAETVACNQ